MSDLDVIVPVHNEAESVEELVERIDSSLSNQGIDYNVIFVDDYSTDNTAEKVKKLTNGKYTNANVEGIIYDANGQNVGLTNANRVKLVSKKGPQGKAYSILEGVRASTANYIAMIDGDLQYPPEAIPEMYKMAHNHGVVVANRKDNGTSTLRKIGSKVNILLFEKLLLGLNCDTQSGLKVFKREVIEHLSEADVTPWTLDMPLLTTALDLGHNIGTVDINFEERKSGNSKVNFIETGLEIAFSALRLKLREKKVYPVGPEKEGSTVGAGFKHKGDKFITHTLLPQEHSAITTFDWWQKAVLFITASLVFFAFLANPIATGILLVAILTLAYFIDLIFSLNVILASLHFPPEVNIDTKEMERLKDDDLPIYSILCPLYKEVEVLNQFINAINEIDWPKNKLDVLLILEEDDEETQKALGNISLPKYFRVLITPHSLPKTKPKACNFGLAYAKGEYAVVYDAEDKPDPQQLKKAYIAFKKLDQKVVCLQSKLNYYNTDQNLLTRLFTAEYSLWFDVILPGLQLIETTIPLGGTSNHFKMRALKYLDGWDPFNVTEDCDLGTRLYKLGFQTAIIDSTTLEEANSNLRSWLKQRSRWIKGYLQTYLVHMRDPVDFYKKHGIHAFIFQLVIGMRMVFILVNPLLWVTTLSYFLLNSVVGPTIESLYPAPIFYLGVISLVFGNFIYLYNYMIGCAKRRQWNLIKYVFLMPFYWAMTSISAAIAFYQLLVKPYYWEKTQHGLHLQKSKFEFPQVEISLDFSDLLTFGLISKISRFVYNAVISVAKNIADLIELLAALPTSSPPNSGRLRILIFNWRDTRHVWAGGAEVYIQEVAKRWVQQGHKVTLFCGWDGQSNRNGSVDGVEVIRRGGFYTVYLFAFLYYLLKFRGKYDIVVDCENGIPFFTPLYVGLPTLLLIHHVHGEVFRQHLPFPLKHLAVTLESRLMPSLYKNHQVITVSESSREDIIKIGLSTKDKIEIVTPGVELHQPEGYQKTNYPSFIYLGRLKPYKNIDIAIKAFARVLAKVPSARLTITGEGECISSLKRLVKKLKITESVVFTGKVSEEEKIKLLSESWVALQPSSFEGWGLTVLEANSCGTPVIASDVKGLRDSVVDGKTGILFPVKDIDGLYREMDRMIFDNNLRQRLSEEAFLWSKRFDWHSSSKKLEAVLYRNITPIFVSGVPELQNLQFEEAK